LAKKVILKMKNFNCKSKKMIGSSGFTLIELLLVVALVGISIGITSDVLVTLMRSFNKTQVLNEVEQQSNFVFLKLTKELRDAQTVSVPATMGVSSNTLTFTTRSNKTVTYALGGANGNEMTRGEGVSNPTMTSLTSPQVIGGVSVECTTGCFKLVSLSPTIVSFSMVFKQANASAQNTFKGEIRLEDTIVLRNSY
jgi:prepilin-type N-terminal cleavage/methylation domain-containing protein